MKLKLILFLSIFYYSKCYSQEFKRVSVFFDTDSFNTQAKDWNETILFIKSCDTIIKIEIYGYCDDRASQEYNLKLSTNRAKKVFDELIKNQILSKKLYYKGMGSIALVGKTKDTAIQRKENRRVDLEIYYKRYKEKNTPSADSLLQKSWELYKQKSLGVITDSQKVGDIIIFKDILFFGRMHRFRPQSYPSLDSLTFYIKKYSKYKIKINGHVCLMGIKDRSQDGYDKQTRTFNLSETRAKAVYEYLIDKGIDSSRLLYEGQKGLYPTGISCGHDRRVEIEIVDVDEDKLENE